MSSQDDSSDSDSKVITEDEDEEEQMYKLIYDMNTTGDKEEKEKSKSNPIPSSSGHTPVHLKINAESRTRAVVGNSKGLDMDGLNDIPEMLVLTENTEPKPWRKAGADISDYFNFGFDEGGWKTYCKKQAKLRAANRKQYTKIMVQRGHSRYDEEEEYAYSSSGSPSFLASRQPTPIRRRPEEHVYLGDEGIYAQMVNERSPKEDGINPFLPPTQSNVNSHFAFIPPPPMPYRSGRSPLSPRSTLDSLGQSRGSDGPSTSLYPCSSGVSSSNPKSKACSAGAIDAAKAWECFIWQERCDKGREEQSHNRDSKRDRESCASSHNSGQEQLRHRDTAERVHRRHSFERFSGEREEWLKERRHRDQSEGWHKSPCSSSSSNRRRRRRDDVEDRDSQSRPKHKKAKRKKKDKESKTCCTDQEKRGN